MTHQPRAPAGSRRAGAAAVLLNLAITVPLAWILNIWMDEAFTIHTTSRGLVYATKQAIHFELQPPLYFALEALWRELNGSFFFARLVSVVCIALTVWVAACLSKRFLRGAHPGWVTFALAVNPFAIWAAVELRVYALAILLGGLQLLTFYDGYLAGNPSKHARWFHVLAMIAALYTQYFLGFAALAAACVLAALRRWDALRRYLLDLAVVAVCCLPIAFVLAKQIATSNAVVTSTGSLRDVLESLYASLFLDFLPVQWAHLRGLLLLALGIAILFALLAASNKFRSFSPETAALVIWTAVTGLMLALAVHATRQPFSDRYASGVFLSVVLAGASAFADVRIAGRSPLGAWAVAAVLFGIASSAVEFKPLAKDGDWARVASFVMAQESPGQPILVFPRDNYLPFSDYYKGPNAVVPIPQPIDFDDVAAPGHILEDEHEITVALSRVPGDHRTLWVVTRDYCHFQNLDYHCEILDAYIGKRYSISVSKRFYKAQVRLLREKTP